MPGVRRGRRRPGELPKCFPLDGVKAYSPSSIPGTTAAALTRVTFSVWAAQHLARGSDLLGTFLARTREFLCQLVVPRVVTCGCERVQELTSHPRRLRSLMCGHELGDSSSSHTAIPTDRSKAAPDSSRL
jgi:hypothetical protein